MLKQLKQWMETLKTKAMGKAVELQADLLSDHGMDDTTNRMAWVVGGLILVLIVFTAVKVMAQTDLLPQVAKKIKEIFDTTITT